MTTQEFDKGLTNKVAIITGASRGIGRETAIRLAKHGVNVVACYRESDAMAKTLGEEVAKSGGRCVLIKEDITRLQSIKTIVKTALDEFNAVDFLINNAGVYERRKLTEVTSCDFDKSVGINLKASFFLCKFVVPIMKERQYGKIVNVSSIIALSGYKYSSHYVSAKAGLIGLTKSLAIELAPEIRVNCVLPGFIETTNLRNDSEERRKERLSKIPLKRLGQAGDVAGVIEFLLSGDADYITGAVIQVSGGYPLVG
jgi:3-oxoacyl-[acyl-carrier protein] reductase